MDDILFISKRRWPLKRLVKKMHQILTTIKQTLRPEKTWMSRIAKGFTYCGYHILPSTFSIAKTTKKKFLDHQKILLKKSPNLLVKYIQRWHIWIKSGIIPQSKIIKNIGLQI